MEKTLSIFIDESGDFGEFDSRSPYYLVTMLFHDQSKDISDELKKLDGHLTASQLPNHCLHTGPLIRREEAYRFWTIDDRKRLLNSFMNFAAKIPFSYIVFAVKKEDGMSEFQLIHALSRMIYEFLEIHAAFLSGFDKFIVYYDNGQKQLTGILASLFHDFPVDFRRKISPTKYRLFQIADLATTLELIELKRAHGKNSTSEKDFFGSMREFHKNYYRRLAEKKIDFT